MATETQQMAPHDASGAAIEWKSTDRVGTRSRLIDAGMFAVFSVGLFALILAPRLSHLDAYVTPDEATWIGRSANFYQALSTGHYKDTYQFVHPGVPVMWLGTLGFRLHIPDMPDLMGRQLSTRGPATQNVLENAGYQIVDVLVELRQMMAIASALILVGTFLCLAKIVRVWVAAAAIAYVSLDPMNIGFSRLLHLDGLSANLILLSVVAFCWHLERRSRVAVVVSGIAAGLACLTRFADVGLVLLVFLFAAFDLLLDWRADRSILRARLRSNITGVVIWGAVAILVFVALWPAMWVAPIETLRTMWQGSTDLADHTQEINILFRGQSVHGDPGWTYYPVVLAYRLSPLTVIGLLFAVIGAFRPRDLGMELPRRLCANLAILAAIYLGILSLAAKKADRYVLPSMVALDLVAALAWMSAAIWIVKRMRFSSPALVRASSLAIVGSVLLIQAGLALNSSPIYTNEANPLLGGTAGAEQVFSFDLGEGGKLVADAIMTIDGYESARIVAGPYPISIDYYMPIALIGPTYSSGFFATPQWLRNEYIVVTRPQVQRKLYSPEMLNWFDTHEPIKTVDDDEGLYARIYDVRNEPLPDFFFSDPLVSTWGDSATLIGGDIQKKAIQGRRGRVQLYFAGNGMPAEIAINVEFVKSDGTVVATESGLLSIRATTTAARPAVATIRLPVSVHTKPDSYEVRITVRDAESGAMLSAKQFVSGDLIFGSLKIGTIKIASKDEPLTN